MHVRAKWRWAACLTVLPTPYALGAQPITASNWQQHPAIVEIRTIYQEVRQAEATGRLHKLQRTFEYCRSYEDTERVLYLDSGGVVRSYHYSGGSEDSTAQHAHYYDRHGKLRFVFVKAGAANGTGLEHRVYLSEAGKLVGGTKAPRSRLDISEPMAGERACQEPQACLRCGEPVPGSEVIPCFRQTRPSVHSEPL